MKKLPYVTREYDTQDGGFQAHGKHIDREQTAIIGLNSGDKHITLNTLRRSQIEALRDMLSEMLEDWQ